MSAVTGPVERKTVPTPGRGYGFWAAAQVTFALLHTIVRHPLNRGKAVSALMRWALWQLGSRLVPGPVVVPFVDSVSFVMRAGDRGLTLNHYLGLGEFEEMAFALHFLREEDLFVDVGANAGAYTMLAAGAAGARAVACEPVPATLVRLRQNLAVNGLGGRVEVIEAAVGAEVGRATISVGDGPMNQIVADGASIAGRDVALTTLDEILRDRVATLIKIDVEGYERFVLQGARRTLADTRTEALIVEIGRGFAGDGSAHDEVWAALSNGWTRVDYAPLERRLTPAVGPALPGNHLFVRDLASASARLRGAPIHRVAGRDL